MLFYFKGKSNKIRSQFYEFPIAIVVCCVVRTSGLFLESPDNFSATKFCFVFAFKIKVSIILKDVIKLSVDEAKLTGLCGRSWECYYSTGFDFKTCLRGPKKFSGLLRNGLHYHVWTEYLESEKECGSLKTGNR